ERRRATAWRFTGRKKPIVSGRRAEGPMNRDFSRANADFNHAIPLDPKDTNRSPFPMMSDRFPVCRLLALAGIRLGVSLTAWADPPAEKPKPHGLRAPWVRRSIQLRGDEKAPEPLRAPPAEVNAGTAGSSPSTHLEVPVGANLKITIEVVGKQDAAP